MVVPTGKKDYYHRRPNHFIISFLFNLAFGNSQTHHCDLLHRRFFFCSHAGSPQEVFGDALLWPSSVPLRYSVQTSDSDAVQGHPSSGCQL